MTNFNFGQLASKWWNPNGAMRSLHDINIPRVKFIKNNISNNHKNVLDIGCGAGILAEALTKIELKVTGIDTSKELIAIAQSHAKIDNLPIQYKNISIADYTKSHSKQFDIVTCLELIEHLENPEELIKSIAKFCNPGGRAFISTINKTFTAWLLGIVAAEHILNIIPKGTHSFEGFIKPSKL